MPVGVIIRSKNWSPVLGVPRGLSSDTGARLVRLEGLGRGRRGAVSARLAAAGTGAHESRQ